MSIYDIASKLPDFLVNIHLLRLPLQDIWQTQCTFMSWENTKVRISLKNSNSQAQISISVGRL